MKFLEKLKWFKPTPLDQFMILVGLNVAFTIFTISDWVLNYTYFWTPSNIPYGYVWTLLNPLYWTQLPYKTIVFISQILYMLPMFYLIKKGKMNRRMMLLYLAQTAMYRYLSVHQEVTLVAALPYGVVLGPLAWIPFLIQRYPFWSLIPNFQDPHYLAAQGHLGFLDIGGNYGILRWFYPYTPDFFTHWTFVYWGILPIYAWWRRRNWWKDELHGKPKWNEDRFWKIWTLPLIALWLGSAIILTFYGCCSGWVWAPGYGPGTNDYRG